MWRISIVMLSAAPAAAQVGASGNSIGRLDTRLASLEAKVRDMSNVEALARTKQTARKSTKKQTHWPEEDETWCLRTVQDRERCRNYCIHAQAEKYQDECVFVMGNDPTPDIDTKACYNVGSSSDCSSTKFIAGLIAKADDPTNTFYERIGGNTKSGIA